MRCAGESLVTPMRIKRKKARTKRRIIRDLFSRQYHTARNLRAASAERHQPPRTRKGSKEIVHLSRIFLGIGSSKLSLPFCGFQWPGHQIGDIKASNVMGNIVGMRAIEIGEHHDRELVVNVARDMGVEAMPGSAVFNQAMAANVGNKPGETIAIRIWLAIVELHRSPHLVEAGALEKFFG